MFNAFYEKSGTCFINSKFHKSTDVKIDKKI